MDKKALISNLFWDYDLSPEDCINVLEGKRQQVGPFTRENLAKRLLESYPWFTIIQLFSLETIRGFLTDQVIKSLRTKKLQERYDYISRRLSRII